MMHCVEALDTGSNDVGAVVIVAVAVVCLSTKQGQHVSSLSS